jgi:hypothetical protein
VVVVVVVVVVVADDVCVRADIEFARRKEDQIHSIFLDPTGNSLIISMENKENWYLHASWKKPRPLSKMKVCPSSSPLLSPPPPGGRVLPWMATCASACVVCTRVCCRRWWICATPVLHALSLSLPPHRHPLCVVCVSCVVCRACVREQGLLIESVAWDTHNTDPSNTGEILIGSRDGRIFETAVEAKDKLFVEGKEKYFKPIYALGEDQVRHLLLLLLLLPMPPHASHTFP